MEEYSKQRMIDVHTMLLEMASGNFYYRIKRTEKNDAIEGLVVTLNMLAEEVQDSIVHQGYANRETTALDLVQMTFILDEKGKLKMVNQQACDILSLSMTDIMGNSFASLLVGESAEQWIKTWKKHEDKVLFDLEINLTFITRLNLPIPKKAFVARFPDAKNPLTLITILHHTNYQYKMHSDLIKKINRDTFGNGQHIEAKTMSLLKPKLKLSFEDIRKVRKAHDVIIKNPENKYPPLKEFALQIGTNEFKLKYGFRELYCATVHDFIMEQRLRKAQMMMQHSDHSFKSIAQMSGFNSMPHFSRTFKKKYGFSPSEFRKRSLTIDKKS